MTTRNRYFVVTSLLVLVVGVGTGLVAYYVGVPQGLLGRSGPEELRYVPANAAIVAYADVHEIMASEVRQKLHRVLALSEDGQREFREQTGIDVESDLDRVVTCVLPQQGPGHPAGLVLARGRFSDVKIEALMREHGAGVSEYKGKRVIEYQHGAPGMDGSIALTFLEPGLVAVGSGVVVRSAIDQQKGGANVTSNAELMTLIRSLDQGNAWAAGRVDALRSDTRLPEQIASQLPSITWFSVSARVDSGISGVVRADTRDEAAANNLRDVVRGFLALARMQAGSRPEFQTLIQSLELGGTGKSVALSFSVPGQVFDAVGASLPALPRPRTPAAH